MPRALEDEIATVVYLLRKRERGRGGRGRERPEGQDLGTIEARKKSKPPTDRSSGR
jgi:hypothetical protein